MLLEAHRMRSHIQYIQTLSQRCALTKTSTGTNNKQISSPQALLPVCQMTTRRDQTASFLAPVSCSHSNIFFKCYNYLT